MMLTNCDSEQEQPAQDSAHNHSNWRTNQGALQAGIITVATIALNPGACIASRKETSRRAYGRSEESAQRRLA
jgi:hypothetical protein